MDCRIAGFLPCSLLIVLLSYYLLDQACSLTFSFKFAYPVCPSGLESAQQALWMLSKNYSLGLSGACLLSSLVGFE